MISILCVSQYTAPDDYYSLSVTLSYPAGTLPGDANSVQCVTVNITDNMAFEKNETFTVNISSEAGVGIADPITTVVIVDDEGIVYLSTVWPLTF